MAEDEKQKLSDKQKDTIIGYINARWKGDKTCPICGNDKWSISDHVITPSILAGSSIYPTGTTYPMAMIICTDCGNTRFFNVIRMGVMEMPWGDGTNQKQEENGKKSEGENPDG